MKTIVVSLLVCLLLPATGHAQISCGSVNKDNQSWQAWPNRAVEFIVETRRDVNICPIEVEVEAWVGGVSMSAVVDREAYTATAHAWIPVPTFGTWNTQGKHWIIQNFLSWAWIGATSSYTSVKASTAPLRASNESDCIAIDGYWDGYACYPINCPLIVNMDHNGYRLTNADNGVFFDLDADGTPERVAWTEADSDDAFLALDRNGNGRIDDGSELFGNHTHAYADEAEPTTRNGFDALKFLEGPSYGPSYADFIIDERDAVFSRLVLWTDRNHNGISEPEELQPVSGSGLIALMTDYKSSGRVDRFGNQFRERAKGIWRDGEYYIYDVWLRQQK